MISRITLALLEDSGYVDLQQVASDIQNHASPAGRLWVCIELDKLAAVSPNANLKDLLERKKSQPYSA